VFLLACSFLFLAFFYWCLHLFYHPRLSRVFLCVHERERERETDRQTRC
jgi:hypothetical protein